MITNLKPYKKIIEMDGSDDEEALDHAKIKSVENITVLKSMQKYKSSCSCRISDIKRIIYGGQGSRFWMMRKHINSMTNNDIRKNKVPFNCWQCLTIETHAREINLVIPKEEDMRNLLFFLIVQIQTIDGNTGTAAPFLQEIEKKLLSQMHVQFREDY